MGTPGRVHEVSKRILWLACSAALCAACDTEPQRDILANHVSGGGTATGGSAGSGGANGGAFAGVGGASGANGTAVAGTGGSTAGSGGAGGAAGSDEFAGAGGGGATDAGIARDGAPATSDCPVGFECVTDPIFNALSACLPMGGGLPPPCTTDADCVKAGLPKGLCLMEEETGLTGCAQICMP
jgi:hypothetical protein